MFNDWGLCVASLALSVCLWLSVAQAGDAQSSAGPNGIVALVDDVEILRRELDAFRLDKSTPDAEALNRLIEQRVLKGAARRAQLRSASLPWDDAERNRVEDLFAARLKVGPQVDNMLIVDHAWVKDSDSSEVNDRQRCELTSLRKLVLAGEPILDAWRGLKLDGTAWHIGTGEKYSSRVIPASARDAALGTVTKIERGSGGQQFFKLLERRKDAEALERRRRALQKALRKDVKVKIFLSTGDR